MIGERERWLAKEHAVASPPGALHGKWSELSLAEKRAYIGDVLAAVLVHPASGSRNRWNPDRLEPIWSE